MMAQLRCPVHLGLIRAAGLGWAVEGDSSNYSIRRSIRDVC